MEIIANYRLRLFFVFFLLLNLQVYPQEKKTTQVLILSGRNNHEWQQITQFLENMLIQTSIFKTIVTNQPDTLKSADFEKYDVVLSNWNSWPENDLRWPAETEKALLQFISEGGGFVTFHASSSVFYKWSEFQEITTASWIMDSTRHGKPAETLVTFSASKHSLTDGLSNFYTFDELWINAAKNENFKVLATAKNMDVMAKDNESQQAVMVAEYGTGRIFHTILGHDIRAMESEGFQTLLIRGTEWAATGKVSQKVQK
jgi:type 1 glutamine amidotransferase